MKITNRFTDALIFEAAEQESTKETVLLAIKSGAYLSGADLSGADLRSAYLSSADLSVADLRGADLSGAYLSGADLSGAYLSGADLSGADLRSADLRGADLRSADLRSADLRSAYLSGADLRGADLSGAKGIYQFGPMPTSGRICVAVWHTDHWMIKAGCFWATLDELEEKVKDSHNCPVYLANIQLLRNYKI